MWKIGLDIYLSPAKKVFSCFTEHVNLLWQGTGRQIRTMRQTKVSDVKTRLGLLARTGLFLAVVFCSIAAAPVASFAAPYAAMVIDARTGKVLHSRNADTQLHPASLTKMMTLYVVFEAIKHGEITLDTKVTISRHAASEPPSKLGLKSGQRIALRYLIRASAIRSANDAATAMGEAISGSEAAFTRRMNRTAKALGMNRTNFRNAHGLTQSGHLSTARDMTTLGRHLLYDFPQYYNLFSRRSADAGVRMVNNTNRRLLANYRGADGIKTGFTNAAGFNLVASARRGNERIIATVFGGRSTASRNARIAELLDLGFRRAPTNATLRRPTIPSYSGNLAADTPVASSGAVGRTIRLVTAVKTSPRPVARPGQNQEAPPKDLVLALQDSIDSAVEVAAALTPQAPSQPQPLAQPLARPSPRPDVVALAIVAAVQAETNFLPDDQPEIVTRISSSGGQHWGINVGRYVTRYNAERVLLKTALNELGTLGEALRKVANRPDGWHANFVGMTREQAELACRRLEARSTICRVIGPT